MRGQERVRKRQSVRGQERVRKRQRVKGRESGKTVSEKETGSERVRLHGRRFVASVGGMGMAKPTET